MQIPIPMNVLEAAQSFLFQVFNFIDQSQTYIYNMKE